jgi:pSer/pThr/pTyr-binding forkhead associated (FHA) protein
VKLEERVTGPFSQFGKHWSRIREMFDGPPGADATPLEICAAVLDDVERRVEPLGGGRRRLPFTRILVLVSQPDADQAPLETALAGLQSRLRTRLDELQCEVPGALQVDAQCVLPRPAEWPDGQVFAVECTREPAAAPAAAEPRGRTTLRVRVVNGAATEESYRFDEPAVYIGRSVEAVDRAGRVRHNHVAFLETVDGVTETVGRAHACFRRNDENGEYRVFDEGSSNGTWVVRDGTAVPVPPRDPRGIRVESGDEIRIGRALIRLSVVSEER